MPEGPVRAKLPAALNVPKGRWLGRAEAGRGEIAFFLEGNGTAKPWRLKVRSPIFVTVSAAPEMLVGYKVADVPAIMGSVDMCLGETDR